MRAIRIETFGAPSTLQLRELPDPAPIKGEVVVAVRAAAVNPIDIAITGGRIPESRLPRTPGRDYAGVVVQGPQECVGKEVWGTSGDFGLTRDGTHAERVVVPATSIRPKPKNLSMMEAGAIGVSFSIAWLALVHRASVQHGETVLIVGASGAVGRAAAQIAHWKGAKVIGADRTIADDLELDHSINTSQRQLPEAVLALTSGKGADVALDGVGGTMFEPTLRSLAHFGRQVAIANVGEPRVSFHLVDFYHQELALYGANTLALDLDAAGGVLDALKPGFESGKLRPPRIKAFSLDEVIKAYQAVQAGTGGEKVILAPREN